MDTAAFLSHLRSQPFYQDQMVHIERIPARQADYDAVERPLSPRLESLLRQRGLWPLYCHQAQALNAIRRGQNVVIATPSASGKSLCYHAAVLEDRLMRRDSTALYLFPTKALAQDQWRALQELACPELLSPEEGSTFDGDTPAEDRSSIRRRARILITNPDMLHLGILPHHALWSRFLRRLRFVVIDETHTYRGAFGSHMAQVLRRLRRLCTFYGSRPQFILATATIANPEQLAQRLVGLPVAVITQDGSPSGGRDFVLWNPPFLDLGRGVRRSANTEAAALLAELMRGQIRSLAFARTRRLTELIYRYCREMLERTGAGQMANHLRPYRAGYLPQLRREIEGALFRGELLGVVATNALELGVDIGSLDATVLTGYPGSIASTWQQAGRSGRRRERALSIFIGRDSPLDQYLINHPEALLSKPVESALLNPDNPHILKPHLLCAAWERPLTAADAALFGESFPAAVAELEAQGQLRSQGTKYYPSPALSYPAAAINLRSITAKHYQVVDSTEGKLLETVEGTMAFLQLHPGAIYLHQGESYLITELDLAQQVASAQPTEAHYYTIPLDLTDVRVLRVLKEKTAGRSRVNLGEVEVTRRVVGFKRKLQLTEAVISEEALDLPPVTFITVALWFEVHRPAQVAEEDFPGGLHALEHAAIGLLPLFALCDRDDIGGLSTPYHPDTGGPTVFIYDAYPGGIGIAERGFDIIAELWQATLETVTRCPCQEGCPSCVQSPKCGNNNQPLDKAAARLLLQHLLHAPASP